MIFVNFFDSFLMSGLRPRNKLRFPHRGRVTFFARAKKVTKETRPRMAPCPTLRGFGSRAAPTRHPVAAGQAQTSLSAPLRALAPSHAVLGCAIRGVENTSTYRSEVGCSNPRRSEPSTEPGRGSSRDSCSSPRRVVCARRVGRVPGGGGSQGVFARSGGSGFGDFCRNKVCPRRSSHKPVRCRHSGESRNPVITIQDINPSTLDFLVRSTPVSIDVSIP